MKKTLILLLALVLVFSVFTGCQSSAPASEEGSDSAASTEPLKIGHLTYHTGPFGHVGPMFDGAANFALDIINEDPPLGRELTIVHQDLGTIGEGQAARKLVDSEKVDILLNVAGEYMSYRDWLLGVEKEKGGPLLPSVHAGAIDPAYGGTVEEPIFRGAPMDTDQGLATAIQAQNEGAKTVVVMAVENDGMQMQQDSAVKGAKALGMEVLGELDFQPEQTSYRSVVSQAQALKPDALLIFCAAEDGGTIVKNAAEMGMSAIIVGATDWLFVEFPQTATMDALNKHKYVGAVGFTYQEGPAWDFYKAAWDASEYASLNDASNSYTLQYYDLLNVSMLAIEKAGGTDVTKWVAAMHDVSMEPGTKVYTYAEGIKALRNGEDIDYDGVTGAFNYTDTGVVGGLYGVFQWTDTENLERASVIEGQTILDLSTKIQ
ncbi:MAG TPA: ABC transporter substrate-binding protein [Anaerovoracaceae bacterium]|nr:ABC transporter substrate-binding protein [Anaerovoracaceae bacterium]